MVTTFRTTYRLFGVVCWSVTTERHDPPETPAEERGSVTTSGHDFGFVRSNLPTWHRED